MIYLSQLLGNPVLDADGNKIGVVNDLGIATGEVFPRVTSLAFQGPGKTPFMISWRKYVESFNEDEVHLTVPSTDIRFSYLQPEEVLIARDLLNKQIVDTRGMKVVRVNDLKLSDTSSSQLRLLGAEVGARGLLRSLSPTIEKIVVRIMRNFGKDIPERVIAWNYMDLLDRNLSNVKLSVTHKTLDELHPADIADIIEQLDPRLRGQVFAQLDDAQAAEAMAELDDDQAAEIVGDMAELDASRMLSEMDPDDAAELVSELDYAKAEKLLRLMGVKEQKAVRQLLGYREDTAGRIMTSEAVLLPEDATVNDAVEALRNLDEDFETVHYIYLKDAEGRLSSLVTMRSLVIASSNTKLSDIAIEDELIVASPEDDQEDVAENIAKYNLLAMPVVDDNRRLLGIVTVDDALDVLEEEHAEDLQIAGASSGDSEGRRPMEGILWLMRNEMWFFVWMLSMIALAALFNSQGWLNIFLLGAMLPVAIIAGNDAASHVTNSFIEYDPDDEDAPTMLGFALSSLGLGIVFALLVGLISGSLVNVVSQSNAQNTILIKGIIAAVAGILVSFALTPLYLTILRKRDEKNLENSGVSLAAIAMIVSAVVFIIVAAVLIYGIGA
ncbi:magnesium transporter MgtE N-terminal domain-containing protein [Atopobium fossor]|uniref:magnesium transporter MgtE N-terminal domain-containing protein n=1 Tax=Atopobium fossor TaxID=39487 RepID=UPI0003FCB6F2|nr:CBS domain-containing protein [Atopobium fossor]